jgi:hypothetical protein
MKFVKRNLSLKECLGLEKVDRTYHINATDINPSTGKAYAINPGSGVWDDNYFDQQYGAQNRASAQNSAQYDNLLQTIPKATDMVSSISNNENSAFNDYLGYLKGQDSPLDFYTKVSDAQGLPQLRKTQSTLQGQIYDLEDTLRRVEPNVTATTGQSIVTEAQRQGMVTEKQKPLIDNLGWLGQSLGRVSGAITEGNQQALNLTQLYQAGTQQFVEAYKTKLDMAMQQGSQALQAFLADNENILNVTLAKIHRGEQVSDQEAQNAFELMKMQTQAKLDLDNQMKIQSSTPNTEIVEVGGRKVLIDKNTGKTIQDLGSSSAPKTGGGTGTIANYYGGGSNSDWEVVPTNNILDYNSKYFM